MTTAAALRQDDPGEPVCDTRDRRRAPRRRQHHREIDRAPEAGGALRRRLAGALGARTTPERIFLGERASVDAPWTTVSYGEALRQVRSIAAWILAQGLSAEHPLAVLSDNSIDHALLALGAMHAGVPVAAISPAYSLMSKDFDKLKSMTSCFSPARSMSPAQSRLPRRWRRSRRCTRQRSSAAAPETMARFLSEP